MASSTPFRLTNKNRTAFLELYNNICDNTSDVREVNRAKFLDVDKSYQRTKDQEQEHVRAKLANRYGNSSRYQNIQVPVVAPQVEAAVQYQTSVFLTGHPLFGVVSAPQFIDEAMQLETVIEDQADRGGWTRELMLFFRDGFKYELSALDVDWETEKVVDLTTDISIDKQNAIPTETLWEGNTLNRVDPYNLILDPRVDPTEIPKYGEFAGYTVLYSRTRLKQLVANLPEAGRVNQVLTDAYASCSEFSAETDVSYKGVYIPKIDPLADDAADAGSGSTNWLKWANLEGEKGAGIEYKDIYELTKLYVRVIPSNLGLAVPGSNTPQIFKLYIVNHKHVIYCERQTNAHNLIPMLIGQPNEDGHKLQTKSLAQNVEPFQDVASAFMNSIMHSRRRAVTDRVLYDPSRITAANINSDNPSAKIPVRPAAYGKNVGESVYQFPYREDQAGFSMQQIQMLLGMANTTTGQNQASQGQFVKGNKTLHEFESVMQNANGREQMTAILIEVQIMQPLKTILKTNILQYQGSASIYNRDKDKVVEVDPLKLRKAILSFKISDGLIPSSKIINADTLQVALQSIATSPQLAGAYNVGPMFSYLMKTQGAPIAEFEKSPEQLAYEQAVASWQNTVAQILQMAPEKELPPQPLPEQFGYNPSGTSNDERPTTNTQ